MTTTPEQVDVYDVENDEIITIARLEAAAGTLRYARSLGAGSPACGVWEQRAVELLDPFAGIPNAHDEWNVRF